MSADSLPASLLRQWAYCSRIPFLREVLGMAPAMPSWVARGQAFDEVQHVLTRDRRFQRLNAAGWTRLRRVTLSSPTLGVHGIADLLLRGPSSFLVCDFKLDAVRIERGARLQLGAYALLAEAEWSLPCAGLVVLSGRPMRALFATWDDAVRRQTIEAIAVLRQSLANGVLPASDAGPAKCGICEHLNHCNDRE